MRKTATNGPWFNEIKDANGKVRSHYQEIYRHWMNMPGAQKRKLFAASKELFSGDYPEAPRNKLCGNRRLIEAATD